LAQEYFYGGKAADPEWHSVPGARSARPRAVVAVMKQVMWAHACILLLAEATTMTTGTAMTMEAMLEAQMVATHTGRLKEFGLSLPQPEADKPKGVPEDAGEMHQWLRLLSFSFLLKAAAIMSSVNLTLSPLRAIWKIQQERDTGVLAPYCFFCVAVCGLQWCAYGTFAFLVTNNYGFLILVYSNVLGVVMGTYYVYTYWCNMYDVNRKKQFKDCCYAAAAIYTFEAVVVPVASHARALLIVGTMSACMSVLVSCAPLAELKSILKSRDASGIPRDIVFASFMASILWLACAALLHDLWILVPNVAGLVLGGFQLFLLVVFQGKEPQVPTLKKEEYYGTMDKGDAAEEALEKEWLVAAGTGGTHMCAGTGESY
jgi:solute carrier family 50 protein (sugar transporter)